MDIAIIGVSCKFPGAENQFDFWNNLKNQTSSISEIPTDRWDWKKYWGDPENEENKTNSRWGGFVNDVDSFDLEFFGLIPRVVEAMDPQQRLMLELTWKCLEDAGIPASSIYGEKVGMFLSMFNHDYKEIQESNEFSIEAHHSTGSAASIIANRVSHYFDINGPSLAIDTACSGSLNAIHCAAQAIQFNDCEMAFAGGINLILTPTRHISFSKMGMMSPTGTCRTFDDSANGYVRGEGAGILLLKPLAKALNDGNQIYGVVKGTAVNHCGETYTLTYPSPEQQSNVIAEAHRRAQIPIESINYVEAHGTGTPKGDPIEFRGLCSAFEKLSEEQSTVYPENKCSLGSVKTNIGHLEAAAGVAGVIKVLMAMRNKTLPALNHYQKLNSRINLNNTPFNMLAENQDWLAALDNDGNEFPLRAGISSFGFGGTNAHVVIEENKPERKQSIRSASRKLPSYPICISAKTESALLKKKEDLKHWLETFDKDISLIDISYTLAYGRDHFEYRDAALVNNLEELKKFLDNGIPESKTDTPLENPIRLLEDLTRKKKTNKQINEILELLVKLYISGKAVDWIQVFKNKRPLILSLPSYPFAKTRVWLPKSSIQTSQSSADKLHPLLHRNISDFDYQAYLTKFTGKEFFLDHHKIRGSRVLPAAAYLEMVYTGLKASLGSMLENKIIQLQDISWSRPFIGNQPGELALRLYPLEPVDSEYEIEFEVSSDLEDEKIVHCNGFASIVLEQSNAESWSDIEDFDQSVEYEDAYKVLSHAGLQYGSQHQGLKTVKLKQNEAIADISLPMGGINEEYLLHPCLLDSALQAAVILAIKSTIGNQEFLDLLKEDESNSVQAPLPFLLNTVTVKNRLTDNLLVNIVKTSTNKSLNEFNVKIFNKIEDGDPELAVSLIGLCLGGGNLQNLSSTEDVKQSDGEIKALSQLTDGNLEGYYVPQWIKSPLQETDFKLSTKSIICVIDQYQQHKYEDLLSELEKRDLSPILIELGDKYKKASESHYVLQAGSFEDSETLVSELKAQGIKPEYLCHFPLGLEKYEASHQAVNHSPEAIFSIVKAMLKLSRKFRAITYIESDQPFSQPIAQGMSGLYKTMRIEKPSFSGAVVQSHEFNSEVLLNEFNDDKATDVFYSDGIRFIRSFNDLKATLSNTSNKPELFDIEQESLLPQTGFKKGGVYLITGGMGALGLIFANHLCDKYQATVCLTGRAPLNEKKQKQLSELVTAGGKAVYVQCDVNSLDDTHRAVNEIRENHGQINGILHSAGIIEDDFIIKKSQESFNRVIAPKVMGSLNLDAATQQDNIDCFILFSSVTGVLGNLGQSDYAYGNSFEDYFSLYRTKLLSKGHRHGKTLSVNWPYWKNGGMSLTDKEEAILNKNFGIIPLETEKGIQALELGLSLPLYQLSVLPGDTQKVRSVLGTIEHVSDQFNSLKTSQKRSSDTQISKEIVFDYLASLFAKELKVTKDRFDSNGSFQDFGFDSVVMIDMINVMEKKFEGLSKTLFFEYQNMDALVDYLIENYSHCFSDLSDDAKKPVDDKKATDNISNTRRRLRKFSDTKSSSVASNKSQPVAIVGLAGRYPEADNLNQFWDNLVQGKDCIREIPSERWDLNEVFQPGKPTQGKSYSKWGGFINNVDHFDPLYFKISPKEAENLDPQERQFLEVVSHAVEDAGYHPDRLTNSRGTKEKPVGVYVGCMWGDYQLHGVESSNSEDWVAPNPFYWSIANRVSYFFDLSGPSITLDTACSSSLTAIHLACNALANGEISVAIAGGVNLSLHPNKYNLLSNMHFLSSDGRCRSFGEGGDGYVPADGVGAVILKPLADAERDGDHIYGVIKSTSINHGGHAPGFTVPDPIRQSALIQDALERGNINPRHVSYLEAHGTGTSLGDPIEINGLNRAFNSQDNQYCAIGSVKSNIGHAEAAAGIAGLTKVLLQMKHQKLVPSIHSDNPNPFIEMESTPFNVNRDFKDWHRPVINGEAINRIAGVSSFGAGGSNGHVIIEEYCPNKKQKSDSTTALIILSAKKQNALQEMVSNLSDYLKQNSNIDLHDLAYTLQTGRLEHEWRFAVTAISLSELSEKLRAFNAKSSQDNNHYYYSDKAVKPTGTAFKPAHNFCLPSDDNGDLINAWMSGQSINWVELYDQPRQKVSAPGYAYQRQRYWIQKPKPTGSLVSLHSVLDSNCSSYGNICFKKTFQPTDFYLRDHAIGENRVLPAVLYLEMAKQAGSLALPDQSLHAIYDVQWLKPIIVNDKPQDIYISINNDDYGLSFEIYSKDDQLTLLHCRGAYGFLPVEEDARHSLLNQLGVNSLSQEKFNIESLCNQLKILPNPEIDFGFSELGFQLGDSFNPYLNLWQSDDEALAELRLPESISDTENSFDIHPSLMDAVLRTTIALGGMPKPSSGIPLPVALNRLEMIQPLPSRFYVWAKRRTNESEGTKNSFEIYLLDFQGGVIAYLERFTTQTVVGLFPIRKLKKDAGSQSPAPTVSTKAKDISLINSEEGDDLRAATLEFLLDAVSEVTKIHKNDLSPQDSLEGFGIDSVMILALNEKLTGIFGDDVSKTLFYEHDDINSMVEYFVECHSQDIKNKLSKSSITKEEDSNSTLVSKLEEQPEPEPIVSVSTICQVIEEVCNEPVSPNTKIASLNIDPIHFVSITNRLSKAHGLNTSALIYNCEKISDLFHSLTGNNDTSHRDKNIKPSEVVDQVANVHNHRRLSANLGNSLTNTKPESNQEDIAIIGLSGKYPMANTLDDFWINLVEGNDCIREVPASRWDHEKNFNADRNHKGTIYGKWGGFMDGIDQFDAEFFGITGREAQRMDPQERLFLETAWQCMEDAAYTKDALNEKSVGVFIGAMWGQYELIEVSEEQKQFGNPGSTFSAIANRVSYTFDFDGPSMAMDTMCSSSLTALHMACQSIRHGDCDYAIAGGVNLSIHPNKYLMLSQLQFLSTDGRCRAFGEGGSGYVPGEGVGAVLLKPISKAIADGDNIYAVVKASALNHGGKTSGFTVPNQKRQSNVIGRAIEKADWEPNSISYIEAHGTGTSLGDPIELSGLNKALGLAENEDSKNNCALGSVKSNIGHLESAAGIAGITKVLLQMKHKTIVSSLHSNTLNPNLAIKDSRFFIPQNNQEWSVTRSKPTRRAGVSSFGAGGSNAHVLLEEYTNTSENIQRIPEREQLFILSADSEERLLGYVRDVIGWLNQVTKEFSEHQLQHKFINLCYTSQVGREQKSSRLAVVSNSWHDLIKKLDGWLFRGTSSNVYFGVPRDKDQQLDYVLDREAKKVLLESLLQREQIHQLARSWVSTLTINWSEYSNDLFRLPESVPLMRISMPSQPLITQRYWVDEKKPKTNVDIQSLHPFLDKNTSTIAKQSFEKIFTGDEFYLKDHQVDNNGPKPILPGVAYLEMARKAGNLSVPNELTVNKISNVMWLKPIQVNKGHQSVEIELEASDTGLEFKVHGSDSEFASGDIEFRNTDDVIDDEWIDISSIENSDGIREEKEEIYHLFQNMGFHYGPAYQCTEWRLRFENSALSKIKLPQELRSDADRYFIHPSLMDSALRTCLGIGDSNHTSPMVPFSLEEVEILHPITEECYAWAVRSDQNHDDFIKYNLVVTDPDGRVLIKVHNVVARDMHRNKKGSNNTLSFYQYGWSKAEFPKSSQAKNVMILANSFEDVENNMLNLQQSSVLVTRGERYKKISDNRYEINFHSQQDMENLFGDVISNEFKLNAILNAIDLGTDNTGNSIDNNLNDSMYLIFRLFRAVDQYSGNRHIRILDLNLDSNSESNHYRLALSGFGASMLGINHRIQVTSLTLSNDQITSSVINDLLFTSENTGGHEYRVRNNLLEKRRLQPDSEQLTSDREILPSSSTCLITGGVGKLGMIMANYLVHSCQPNLILTSRSNLSETQQSQIANLNSMLRSMGSTSKVVHEVADISDAQSAEDLIKRCKDQFGHISAVIHAAGFGSEGSVLEIDKAEFDRSLTAKVQGLIYLHENTKNEPLSWFVNFSSISVQVGDLGIGSYAAGNRFMDSFSSAQNNMISINWPLWDEGGLTIPDSEMKMLAFSGMAPLPVKEGLKAFELALLNNNSQLFVAYGDTERINQVLDVNIDSNQVQIFSSKAA